MAPSRGQPAGKIIKIGNIDAYVAEPKGKKHDGAALLYLPDVFGIWPNSQLMADQFAENGYYTIIPDLFNGDCLTLPRPENFDIMKWLTQGSDGKNPHTKEAVDPIVEATIQYLKEQGFTKIGGLGYCFGAKVSKHPSRRRGFHSDIFSFLEFFLFRWLTRPTLVVRDGLVRCPPLQARH